MIVSGQEEKELLDDAERRTALAARRDAALLLFLGINHGTDLASLFRDAGSAVPSPVAGISERSAERGRKAAEAFKAMDRVLGERVQEGSERIQKQFEEAEKGR